MRRVRRSGMRVSLGARAPAPCAPRRAIAGVVGESSLPVGPCAGNTAAYGNSATDGDAAIMGNAQQCGAQLLASTSIGANVSDAWQTIEADAAKGAGDTLAVEGTVIVGMTEILPLLLGAGSGDALIGILEVVLGYIMQALTLGAVTTISGAAAIGAAAGYIGLIVGAVIGAITAAVNILSGGPTVQITNGATVKCTTYVQTNMPSAVTWLTSQKTLQGVTARWVADTFGLFLFNPVWGTINQGLLGMTFPSVPSAGTGDPVDQVYQLPAAYELTNRMQLAELCYALSVSPGKLPFFASTPWAINLAKASQGTIPLAAAESEAATFATPDQNLDDWQTVQFPLATSEGPCTENCDYAVLAWPPGQRAQGATSYLYAGCLNLLTNTNTVSNPPTSGYPGTQTTMLTQTDISPAAYAAQVLYPTVTTAQCDQVFSTDGPYYQAYLDNFNAAEQWAFAQTTLPLASQLQSGSQWNLTADDASTILQAWATRYSAVGASVAAQGGITSGNAAASAGQTSGAASAILASVSNASQLVPIAAGATSRGFLSGANSWANSKARIASMSAADAQRLLQASNAGDAGATSVITGTASSAIAGDPVAVANLATLSTVQRFEIIAEFVSHYVSPAAGNAVLTAGAKLV